VVDLLVKGFHMRERDLLMILEINYLSILLK